MRVRAVPCLLAVTVGILAAQGARAIGPQQILEQIDGARLDPSRAVRVERLRVDAGPAQLILNSGTLYPATPVAGRPVEMVFLGDATLQVDPRDDVERAQLELFTGAEVMNEPITEAVIVVCLDEASELLLQREPVSEHDPQLRSRANELFAAWKESKERELLDVRGGLLIDATGDPSYQSYFAGRLRSEELGVFMMLVDPDSPDQFSLGKFEPIETTQREERRNRRHLARQQQRGRLLGLDLDDLGVFDQWVLTPLRSPDGAPAPGYAAFEPRQYDLDVVIDKGGENLHGTARLRLESMLGTRRVVSLRMTSDLRLKEVRGPDGHELFFLQGLGSAYAFLDETPERGSMLELQVEFEGAMVLRVDNKVFRLRDTTRWYPRVGDDDRAPYNVKLTWPSGLDLLAMGRRVDAGSDSDGRQWEKRVVEFPSDEYSFEIGKFFIREFDAGDVHVTLAFDRLSNEATKEWIRDQIAAVIRDSLAFYQQLFGPYPLDYLTVVTVPRSKSQGLLGFATISDLLVVDLTQLRWDFSFNDRRIVIAHEIAHQWWGNILGWQSYRDQWLSEALANYSAMLWARTRLEGVPHRGPLDRWWTRLRSRTLEGRPMESIGPLTLGGRLSSSKADAYEVIVYQKGAVVLSTLSHIVGESLFVAAQKRLAQAARFRKISTEDYITAMATMTSTDLEWFSQRYLRATGLPEISYRYELGQSEDGKWPIKVVARQQTPYRFRHRVEKLGDGRFDVRRDTLGQIDVSGSRLNVPFKVAVFDPDAEESRQEKKARTKRGSIANAAVTGQVMLEGQTTETEILCEHEPEKLWLDPDHAVFGLFFSEDHAPKRMLLYHGTSALAEGDANLAEELLQASLETALEEVGEEREQRREEDELDTHAQILLADLYLTQERLEPARESLEGARQSASGQRKRFRNLFLTLEARIAVLEGDFEAALKLLGRGVRRRSLPTEAYLLAAIAASQTGDDEILELAVEAAERRGADLSELLAESLQSSRGFGVRRLDAQRFATEGVALVGDQQPPRALGLQRSDEALDHGDTAVLADGPEPLLNSTATPPPPESPRR